MKPDDHGPDEEWFHALFATMRHAAERHRADLTRRTLERLRAQEDDPRFAPVRLDRALREAAAYVIDAWLAVVHGGWSAPSEPGPDRARQHTKDER